MITDTDCVDLRVKILVGKLARLLKDLAFYCRLKVIAGFIQQCQKF